MAADEDEMLQMQNLQVSGSTRHHHHHHRRHTQNDDTTGDHHHHHRRSTHSRKHHDPDDADDTLAQQSMTTLDQMDTGADMDNRFDAAAEDEMLYVEAPLGNFMFCDNLKRLRRLSTKASMRMSVSKNIASQKRDSAIEFYSKHFQPSTSNNHAFAKGHLPGRTTITSLFHMESNRENKGPDDDGLEDSDLTAADGIVRVKKERAQRKSFAPGLADNLKITKGDFTFPHRTYKPKCQIAYRVGPGQVPQAVMAERLHRIYRKTDINLVLQQLGIEMSDLIPPPNYGETNERFYQEMMFRNRTKINGLDKKEVLAHGGRMSQFGLIDAIEEEEEEEGHMHKPSADSTLSASSGSSSSPSGTATSKKESSGSTTEKEEEDEAQGNKIHPFIYSKPPFNPQFPLSFFDNTEFDIRSGEDWCRLGWDEKERKFYPLPAKAFLPMPMSPEKRMKAKAPSEMTIEEILRKTPRLERFRTWLLRERFERQVRMVGLDPTKIPRITPSEIEMAIVARLGSTVETMASLSDDSMEEIHKAAKKFSERLSKIQNEIEISQTMMMEGEMVDDDEGEDSDSDLGDENMEEMKDEDQLNIVYKKRTPKRDIDDLSDDEDKGLTQNEDAKKSASLLSEVFSDLDSLTMLGSDIITTLQMGVGAEIMGTDAEEYEEDTDGMIGDRGPRGLNRPARSYFMGDYGINVPSSPDIDPFEDGLDQYVIDFDKMKKVHIYDWKWVEVAVFDYHPAQNKYFVRTIFPPLIYAWVNKVYLCFDAEDPNKHGLRIRDAIKRRIDMENAMRYNLYVDCLPMFDFPTQEDEIMTKITKRAISASNMKTTEHAMVKVKREINLEYQRSIAEEKFQRLAERHHKTFQPWVQIPNKNDPSLSTTDIENSRVAKTDDFPKGNDLQNFEYKVKNIQKNTVIYTDEAWQPYKEITNICLDAMERHIILTKDLTPMHLDDWEKMQLENVEEIKRFLEEEWFEMVVVNLRSNFERTNKSWYNLDEVNYDVFLMSKLSNFLQLIKLLMQDTIRSIVLNSCNNVLEQVKAFSENIDPNTDWSWGDDLIQTEFPPPKGLAPLWTIEMYMDPHLGPKYAQPLQSFCRSMYTVFTKALQSCQNMPTLLMKVMPQMQFAALGFLRGVQENEAEMVDMAHNLIKFTKLILLPLDSYIRKFARYREIWTLDIQTFVNKLEASDPTAKDIKQLVEQNRRHVERLEKEIPSEIKITAFRVVVEHVRESILKKKKTMITSILDSYAYKLRKIIQKVQKDYQDMEKKLTLRSDDIEEVMELKGFVEIVPSLVARLDSITNAAIKDYEVFDHFMYSISNEDTNAKWQAAINSNRITRLGREAIKWLEDDYERLLKVQQADLSSLSDAVDSATLTVAGLAAFTELEKAKDVCEEIKKIWKTIKELQEQSALLNRRQKIFGLAQAQTEAVHRLIRDIEPFKNLWFTAADWLNVQDSLFSGSLEKVDVEQMVRVISEGGKVIGKCIKYFAGADQIQHIAKSIKQQLEEFKPLVPLIIALKKPELRQRHWQAISDDLGFTYVGGAGQNLKKLLDQGVQNHVKEIVEIGELATKEFEVEQQLNRMIQGITTFSVGIVRNEEYKLNVVDISPETLKSINEYIDTTNKLMENPYNTPFLEKLNAWEKKIKFAKVSLEGWFQAQDKWLNVQPTFMAPDVATKMPVSHKLYEKINRIWRRLLRLARDTVEIIELLSNNTTLASLQQFNQLLGQLEKSLEEYMRPKGSDESDDD